MQDSSYASKLNRQLYYYRNAATSVLRSRTYTLGKSIRVVVKSPLVFAKKLTILILRNPRRLARIVTGQQTIQNAAKDRLRLDAEYAEWIEKVEAKSYSEAKQRTAVKKFKKQPLVSLITPVFNPPVEAHNQLIESVVGQTYENFELLLFNFGDKPEVEELLNEWAERDERIVVKHGLPNGGISKNSNLCLKYVKGEYIGLLDHDDELMPNALFECVKAINDSGAEFIYTDKDKITEDGERHEPFFKPDLSPEMLLGGNYLTHFDLMKTSIVKKIGGWDPQTDGAQDWDLFLRILDETDKVAHIPKILYHWRTVAGSTASSMQVKPYALKAQRLAVNKHLKKHHLPGEAVQDETGQTYIRWQCPEPVLYLIHMAYGDVGNVKKSIKHIISSTHYNSQSQISVFVEKDTLSKKQQEEFNEIQDSIQAVTYETGSFVAAATKAARASKLEKAIYITDSIKKLSSAQNEDGWSSQLCGWLSIPGVSISGGAAYAQNGQIVDIGSFFNPRLKAFEKYYFSTGFRSGYSGYTQWIRNLVLVSERIFAFKTQLMAEAAWKSLAEDARDDELAKALALTSYSKGNRAIYDPTVWVTDNAPFYLVMQLSPALNKHVSTKCKELMSADPYYNLNLNSCYEDPKPIINKQTETAKLPMTRTVELL